MLLGEIYFKSHILFLAPSICLSPYALQLFWSLAMQKTKVMHKHKHEYALICRAWCPFIVRATPSGCLGWGLLAPSLIPNDVLVARSLPCPQASLPPTPLCLPFFFPACLICSHILGCQSLKATLALEVLIFCTYFSGRKE